MDKPLFNDKSHPPDDALLKTGLRKSFALFNKLCTVTADFQQEWKYYSSSGWLLKVTEKKKALLYLSPKAGIFLASMAIREKDRDALLTSTIRDEIKEELRTAKKYPEGYLFLVEVTGRADAERVMEVLCGMGKIA